MSVINHAPLVKVHNYLAHLRRSGIEIGFATDGRLTVKHAPITADIKRVWQFMRICEREIKAVLAAGDSEHAVQRLESLRWAFENGRLTEERD